MLGNGKKRLPVAAARGAGVGDGSLCIAAAVGQASCKATRCMGCYTSRAAGDGHWEGWLGWERVGSSGGAVADRSLRSLAPAMGMQSRLMPMHLVVFAVVVVLQQHQQQVHPQGRRRRSWGNWGRRCRRRRTCFICTCPSRNAGSVDRVEGGRFCLVDDAADQPPGLDCSPVEPSLARAGKGLGGVIRLFKPSQRWAWLDGWKGWMGGRPWDWRMSRGRGGEASMAGLTTALCLFQSPSSPKFLSFSLSPLSHTL